MATGPTDAGRPSGTSHTAKTWQDLTASLGYQVELLDELRAVLVQQRTGVARNDTTAIEQSIHGIGRVLLTLKENRDRRAVLLGMLTGGHEASLDDLEAAVGEPVPRAVHDARAAARRAGGAAARELAINQHIVQRALDAGDAFIQRLFSETSPIASASPDAVMLNRRA